MQRTIDFIVLFFVLNFTGFSESGIIRFEQEIYDFGVVSEGTEVNYTYIFRNTGKEILKLESVRPACGCTVVSDWDKTVAPGEKGKIPVTFKTPRLNGEISKVIFVKTAIPGSETIQLTLKGRVVIPVEIVPQNTWLGDVTAGTESLSGSFVITNNLTVPLKITEIIPPDANTKYTITVVEENKKYRLAYTVNPPFAGKETISKQFTVKTDNEKYPVIYPQFFYFIQPPVQIYPGRIRLNPDQWAQNSIATEINIKSNLAAPIRILDLSVMGGKGILARCKEKVKDKYYQVIVTIPVGFVFPQDEKVSITFRVENDPGKTVYAVPLETAEGFQ